MLNFVNSVSRFVMPKYEKVLGERYAVTILAYLLENNEVLGSQLRDVTANYVNVIKTAQDLQKLGLVKIRTIQKPYLSNYYSLTEKGKKVAVLLRQAEEIIDNS